MCSIYCHSKRINLFVCRFSIGANANTTSAYVRDKVASLLLFEIGGAAASILQADRGNICRLLDLRVIPT